MKKVITSFFTILFFKITLFSQTYNFDSVGYKGMEIGKMMLKNDNWIIHVDRGSFEDNYWPVNLPEKYKVNGQEVVFEGALGRIPVNSNLPGNPIELKDIRNLYRTKPDNTNKSNGEKTVTEDSAPATKNKFDSIGFLTLTSGKIIKSGDVYLIEQFINNERKLYHPEFFPDDFKMENAQISFSGIIGSKTDKSKVLGIPFKIKEIMIVENIELDISQVQESVKPFFPIDSVGYLSSTKATIKLMGSDPGVYIIEVAESSNSITRYLPAILPDEFKKDGLVIIVSGNIGKIPPNVRLMGTPFEIKEIKLNN